MKIRVSIHNTFRLALIALFVLLALGPLTARTVLAQGSQAVTLETVQVDIWPEYDQPSVLVIYHVSLASSVTLPASLTMRIPSAAGKPFAVAMQDVNGLYDLNYQMTAAGEWINIAFTTPVPDFRLEFYAPLAKDSAKRTFDFTWPADYTTNNLVIKVQQPIAASNVTFSPSIGSGTQSSDGLTYFSKLVGRVPQGTTVDLQMNYDNPQGTLTNPQQFTDTQPSQPVDASTPGRVTLLQGFSMTPLQVVLLIAGLVLIVGGLIYYWTTGRGDAAPRRWLPIGGPRTQPRRRHARSTAPLSVEAEGAPENVFCHHCGKRAGIGDTFCRACGTKLRW